jgi:small subunit ribosomal protein S16
MLIIRLQRVGRVNDPSFRVIVTESQRAAKTGNFIEVVGSYDARQGKPKLNAERIKHWIKNGAQVSDTVHNLLIKEGIIEGKIIVQIPEKPAEKAAEVLAPAAPATAEPAPAESAATEASAEPAAAEPATEPEAEETTPEA